MKHNVYELSKGLAEGLKIQPLLPSMFNQFVRLKASVFGPANQSFVCSQVEFEISVGLPGHDRRVVRAEGQAPAAFLRHAGGERDAAALSFSDASGSGGPPVLRAAHRQAQPRLDAFRPHRQPVGRHRRPQLSLHDALPPFHQHSTCLYF